MLILFQTQLRKKNRDFLEGQDFHNHPDRRKLRISVFGPVMLDKGLCLTIGAFFPDLLDQPVMIVAGVKDFFFEICVRTMILGQDIGHPGSQSYFNPLNGIKNEKTELTVEDIEIQHRFKRCSGPEMMFRIPHLKRESIGAEPVIADHR